jgi:intein/homing endonuclease
MSDGSYKPIEEIRVGDFVYTKSNRLGIVVRTFSYLAKGTIYRIKVQGLPEELRCSPEHPFFVTRNLLSVKARHYHRKWYKGERNILHPAHYLDWNSVEIVKVFAKDLKVGDFVLIPYETGSDPQDKELLQTSEDIARLLGYWLAEGCFSDEDCDGEKETLVFSLNKNSDQDIIQDLLDIASKYGKRSYTSCRDCYPNTIQVRIKWPEIIPLIRKHLGYYSTRKYISSDILQMPVEWQWNFVSAYFLGDGCCNMNGYGVSACTSSISLAYGLQSLCARLGMFASISKICQKEGSFAPGKIIYQVDLALGAAKSLIERTPRFFRKFEENDLQFPSRVNSKAIIHNGFIYTRITDIATEEYEGSIFNFEVVPDHSYIANGVAVFNSNGDLFEDTELEKSYHTFIGKGVYYNHDSDSPDKAFGIILDATYHAFPDDKYVQILAAIDKEEIEKKRPGLLSRIMSGQLRTTSMSCLPAGTPVILRDGSVVPIEQIRVGDEVLTHLGRPRKVTQVFRRPYKQDIFVVKPCGLPPLRITYNHPVLIVRKEAVLGKVAISVSKNAKVTHYFKDVNLQETVEPVWVNVEDLKVGDFLLMPIPTKVETPSYVTRDLARLLGYYLAEGYVTDSDNRIEFSFHINETEFHQEVSYLIKRLTGKDAKIKYREKDKGASVVVYDRWLRDILVLLGGRHAPHKKLDESVLYWDPELQLELVGALINGDGFSTRTSRDVRTYTTYVELASQSLIYQIRLLLLRNGITCNIENRIQPSYDKWGIVGGRPSYRISIPAQFVPKLRKVSSKVYGPNVSRYSVKHVKAFSDNYLLIPIVRIEKEPFDDFVYNLEVEEDHSYIVGGVVVHNCLVQECICSLCGNVARSPEELCMHMNPKSPNYVKGRVINGKRVYEINRGLTFIEDSIVDVPADPTAYIFQIFASYDVQNPKLVEHLKKYAMVKEAMLKQANPGPAKPTTIDELIDKTIETKIENRVKQIVDEHVRKVIDPVLQKIDEVVSPKIEVTVKEKVEEKKEELPEVLKEKIEPEAKEETEKAEKSEEKTEKEEAKDVVPEVIEQETVKKESRKIENIDQTKSIKKLLESPEKIKLKEYPERIIAEPYVFKLKGTSYEVYVNDQKIGSIPIPEDFGILPRKSKEKFLFEKAQKLNPEKTTSASLGGKKMQGTYIRGDTFENSYFIFSEGDKAIKVRASDIIPLSVQERIKRDDPTVVEPKDVIDQVMKMSQGSYSRLKNEVLPVLAKRAYLENQRFIRKADWSFNEEEIPSIKMSKPSEGPVISVSSEEVKESVEKPEAGPSVKIKQYFSRLPNKGVGEPTQTINIQSSTSEDQIIKAKIELLKRALEEEKEKREKAEKELSELKEKTEKKDKAAVIESLIDKISGMTELEDEQKTKLTELLNKFALPQLNIVGQIIDIILAKPIEKATEGIAGKSLEKLPVIELPEPGKEMPTKPEKPVKKEASIPQIFISNEDTELDIIEIAQKSLEK